MATKAEMVIRVTSSRGASTISYITKGRYVSTPVNGLGDDLTKQPIQPTASTKAFWQSIVGIISADIDTLD